MNILPVCGKKIDAIAGNDIDRLDRRHLIFSKPPTLASQSCA